MCPTLKTCGLELELGPRLLANGSTLYWIQSCLQTAWTWGQAALYWSQNGPKLEPSGSKLGRGWDLVGRSWIQVDVAAMSDRNMALGRCWACWADLQKVQISNSPRALVGGPPSEHPPPQLKLYQLSRSVPCFDSWTITPRHLRCGGFPAFR